MNTLIATTALLTSALAGVAGQLQMPVTSMPDRQSTPATQPMPQSGAVHGMGGRLGLLRADANHDGVVTRAEAQIDADRRFDRIDGNRDGRIDAAEMQAMRDAVQARRTAAGQAETVPPPGGKRHAPDTGPKANPNGDGTITREEWRARTLQRFDRIDANRDGKLDASEVPQPRFQQSGGTAP